MTNKYTIISQIITLIICEIIVYWFVIVPNNPLQIVPKMSTSFTVYIVQSILRELFEHYVSAYALVLLWNHSFV